MTRLAGQRSLRSGGVQGRSQRRSGTATPPRAPARAPRSRVSSVQSRAAHVNGRLRSRTRGVNRLRISGRVSSVNQDEKSKSNNVRSDPGGAVTRLLEFPRVVRASSVSTAFTSVTRTASRGCISSTPWTASLSGTWWPRYKRSPRHTCCLSSSTCRRCSRWRFWASTPTATATAST